MKHTNTSRYSFLDDYSEGCHEKILQALFATNLSQQTAYSEDEYSAEAKSLIRDELGMPDVPVHLVATGTKGRVLGLQFRELFGASLFHSLPKHVCSEHTDLYQHSLTEPLWPIVLINLPALQP